MSCRHCCSETRGKVELEGVGDGDEGEVTRVRVL
jgi:hypothetical protein